MEIIHVAISDFLSNLIHFKFGVDQEIFGMIYAYFVDKYIKPFADLFVENLAELRTIVPKQWSDIFQFNIVHIIMLDVMNNIIHYTIT